MSVLYVFEPFHIVFSHTEPSNSVFLFLSFYFPILNTISKGWISRIFLQFMRVLLRTNYQIGVGLLLWVFVSKM